jgi:hypothetical protein
MKNKVFTCTITFDSQNCLIVMKILDMGTCANTFEIKVLFIDTKSNKMISIENKIWSAKVKKYIFLNYYYDQKDI